MRLSDQQKIAVEHNGNALVVACPGSGKTRAIIAKLLRCVDEVRNTPRQVACITYTNAATNEIENRIRIHGSTGDEDYCDVSTIHAFCQNNILRHFYWRIKGYKDGYTILPPDSELFIQFARDVVADHGLSVYSVQLFEMLNRKPSGEPITSGDITVEAASDFWSRLQAKGYIDFCNIVYLSFRLLKGNPSIASSLGAKFPYILVDEFQDTSSLQANILKIIADQERSAFFLVGDPVQSIYSFAGAEPDKMYELSRMIEAKEYPLSGNFRSSPPVIRCAESLIARVPEMFSSGDSKNFNEETVYEHADSDFSGITDYFLPAIDGLGIPLGDAAILAPSYYKLLPLGKKLREYGVPIVGPGARPYKRSHLFSRLAEQVCAYLVTSRQEFIRYVEKEIFYLVINITGKANFDIFTFSGRRAIFRLLRAGEELRRTNEGAIAWLEEASSQFADILSEEKLLPSGSRHLITESVNDMVSDMDNNKVDTANMSLGDLGVFANPENNLKLLTMHKAKGCEYSAVALVGLHDGVIPFHNQYNPLSEAREAESRRLLYVAITRAKRLVVFLSNREEYRDPSRFLAELGFLE